MTGPPAGQDRPAGEVGAAGEVGPADGVGPADNEQGATKADTGTDTDTGPLVLAGRLWPTFAARTVVLTPGSALPYAEADWRDALIVVESGELEVETSTGRRQRFAAGDMLWFTGLDLRLLRSTGAEAAVLKAVSRQHRRRRTMDN